MIIYQKWIKREDLRANPTLIYVFGDNEIRRGYGGQAAEMRGEPNAVGIATLIAPGQFWRETNIEHQCSVIDADMAPLFAALKAGKIIVWPTDGVGSGLADLEYRSPTTWRHLQKRVAELKTLGNAK